MSTPVEIERKWMVTDWPNLNRPCKREQMRQGYLTVHPTVRIREEAQLLDDGTVGQTKYILCFKKGSGIARQELEFPISKKQFEDLEDLIALPLIPKIRYTYCLSDGSFLEVNHVDEGLPTEFWYAEVEFESIEVARAFDPTTVGLGDYLIDDVTDQPGQSMGSYWIQTRERKDF